MKLKQYNYNKHSKYYDILEGASTLNINYISNILKKTNSKKIIDITCGTGAQIIELKKRNYNIIGYDLNKEMIKVAKKKAKKSNLKITFKQGNMINSYYGKFDAIISMFNAIGHLTKEEFEKALENIKRNLKNNGIYIFDIFNFEFMKRNFRNYEFIDSNEKVKDNSYVRLNHNKLDKKNKVMNINQKTYIQKGFNKPKIFIEKWDMKIYSYKDLKNILEKHNFKILKVTNEKGKKFNNKNSLFILIVAMKK